MMWGEGREIKEVAEGCIAIDKAIEVKLLRKPQIYSITLLH